MAGEYIDFEGRRYELSHLKNFRFDAIRPETEKEKGWTIAVQVSFSWHCYTRKPDEDETSKILMQGKEERCFCVQRHELSLRLPDIVRDLMERKVFQTGQGNYITVEGVDHEGNRADYEVYFRLRKKGKGEPLRLFIESAYVRKPSAAGAHQKRRRQAIRFRVLAYNVHHGKGVRYNK